MLTEIYITNRPQSVPLQPPKPPRPPPRRRQPPLRRQQPLPRRRRLRPLPRPRFRSPPTTAAAPGSAPDARPDSAAASTATAVPEARTVRVVRADTGLASGRHRLSICLGITYRKNVMLRDSKIARRGLEHGIERLNEMKFCLGREIMYEVMFEYWKTNLIVLGN